MSESLDFVFERANSALITQDFEYAERLLTNVLKKHPDISPNDKEKIENLLARIYGDEGDLERALSAYLRLYERAPDNIELMLNLGRIYRHLGRYEDALKILKKAQETGGDTDEVLYNFAKTHKRMHNYEKAAGYFLRAIEIKPDHAHAYDRLGNLYVLTGETDKAIEIYKKGLRVDPNHPYLNFHLAKLLYQEKRYEEAVVYYNSALRVNPAWSEVLSGIAAAYLQLDKLDDALNTYRSLLRVTGESAPLYTELGYLFEKKHLQQEAEQYYYDALALDSGYAPAALALTRFLEQKQRYNDALSILLAAETSPVNTGNHTLRLKAIQMCMYAKDYAKANELFGRLDTEYGNTLNALKLRGQLYALMGELEQAERAFRQILNTAPSAIEFRQELAEQYLLAHKYEEAKEQLSLFLKQRPTNISALMALGRTEELLNNPQAAYQEYQKVLNLNPDAIEARSALSRLFQKRGDTLAALETANEILNLQSSSETNEDDMASSLDLYEQAAESYIADPLLTKNLEKLKPDDSLLYISPAELNPNSEERHSIPSLQDLSKAEGDLPFDISIEGNEEIKELPSEKNEFSIFDSYTDGEENLGVAKHTTVIGNTTDSISAVSQPQSLPPVSEYSGAAHAAFTFPTDELYINTKNAENNEALGIGAVSQKTARAFDRRQNLLRDEATQERLKTLDVNGTTMTFLQDIISDIDKQLDENRYTQAVEILAQKIAENLSRKISFQTPSPQEASQAQQKPEESAQDQILQQPDEPDVSNEDDVCESNKESVQVTEVQEDFALGHDHNTDTDSQSNYTSASEMTEKESTGTEEEVVAVAEESTTPEEEVTASEEEVVIAEDSKAEEAKPFFEYTDEEEEAEEEDLELVSVFDGEMEPEQEVPEHSDSFILDQEQQNLLWCHAQHRIKDSPVLEEYLNTADPEQLTQLFLYLRDLFAYLPQEELEGFLNSSERIQIYYIIARLSGELGLKERANLIQQANNVVNTPLPYNGTAVLELLNYLRDLSIVLPDQGLGKRLGQDLERLVSRISPVLPDV